MRNPSIGKGQIHTEMGKHSTLYQNNNIADDDDVDNNDNNKHIGILLILQTSVQLSYWL